MVRHPKCPRKNTYHCSLISQTLSVPDQKRCISSMSRWPIMDPCYTLATPEVNEWSSNETTPTGDAEFAKISKELPKSGKRLSNRERRDNLLKFAEAMNACGMRVPPKFSSQISTPATAHRSPQHDSSTVTTVTSIPSWLRTRRLHRYEHCFQGISWAEMFKFTEADLEARGVCTLGARRRLIKSLNELRERRVKGC
ncbi:hypothetical protein B0H14DRAFT_2747837 [Mycena olivaceomarginata]|nr:hypothetical protein B0H14DRAFT_2747837 [Mycena olivaceomarginata]